MSDPAMASTSTYGSSIKFYEQMSHLQGELKGYESQHFNLEEEFQRLWTQGTSVPAYSSNGGLGLEPKNTTRPLTQLGHLSEKSQLLANPSSNPNLPNYGDQQDRRRARNTAILDKLQELETNASIFAARSERLKIMRNEYENLVRKYSTTRNGGQKGGNSRNRDHPKNEHPINLTSTSVNTDISGPVIAVSSSAFNHPGKTTSLNVDIRHPHQDISSQQLSPHPDGHGLIAISDQYPNSNPNFAQFTRHRGSFLHQESVPSFYPDNIPIRKKLELFEDLSTTTSATTESVDWDSKFKQQQQQYNHFRNYELKSEPLTPGGTDYVEDGTTSLSGVLSRRQSRSSNYIENISPDGSSESTSTTGIVASNKRNPKKGHGGGGGRGTSLPPTGERTKVTKTKVRFAGESPTTTSMTKPMGKTFMISSASEDVDDNDRVRLGEVSLHCHHTAREEITSYPPPDRREEREDFDRDDSMASVGDSVMDSICNKTPDSLPRDDFELLHIPEMDDEQDEGGTLTRSRVKGELLVENREKGLDDGIQDRPPYSSTHPKEAAKVSFAPESVREKKDQEIKPSGNFVGVYDYETPEQDQEGNGEFNDRGRNKGVAINGDELGGVGNEFAESGGTAGAKMTSQVVEGRSQGALAKLGMRNEKQTKPSVRKKLKMDYDDSESEEHSEKGKKDNANTSILLDKNSSLLNSLKKEQVPTKEDLDAEFEEFFA